MSHVLNKWPLSSLPRVHSPVFVSPGYTLNMLKPRQNGRHFADIFKCIFLNENVLILIKISLKFVTKGPINNIPALVQIMAWRRPGDKPLSEPMLVSLLTHICFTLPQWVKILRLRLNYWHFADDIFVSMGALLVFLPIKLHTTDKTSHHR